MIAYAYAHPKITPTLRRVLAVLNDMPGGATVEFIAHDVYAKPTPESGVRRLRTAIKLGVEQGLLMVAGRVRNKPGARGPAALVYMATLTGLQHVEVPACWARASRPAASRIDANANQGGMTR